MSTVPESIFAEAFVRLNRLDKRGFQRWVFQPGMDFGTQDKWWNSTDKRDPPHEGLDFCCFETSQGQLEYLAENTLVPVMYDGAVARLFRDFLGSSILVAHDFQDKGRNLYTVFAHVKPLAGVAAGKQLQSGEPIATICPAKHGNMNPHLHLSVIWADAATVGSLDWQTMHDVKRVSICNPLNFLRYKA